MFISNAEWANFRNIINGVHEDFNQAILIWKKLDKKIDRFKEEAASYTDIQLKCLIQYNVFRTWPMTVETDAGSLDGESITVFINNKYLSDLGYLLPNSSFKFDPGVDLFDYKGQLYRSSGETPVSQVDNNLDLFTMLILKRIPTETSQPKY